MNGHAQDCWRVKQIQIVSILYCAYLLLRVAEAWEFASVIYAETNHLLLSATSFFVFMFGVLLLAAGVRQVGEQIALTWHVILEILLVHLSLYFAYVTALRTSGGLLAALSIDHRFEASVEIFLVIQALLAIAGVHVIRWKIKANMDWNLNG